MSGEELLLIYRDECRKDPHTTADLHSQKAVVHGRFFDSNMRAIPSVSLAQRSMELAKKRAVADIANREQPGGISNANFAELLYAIIQSGYQACELFIARHLSLVPLKQIARVHLVSHVG